MAIPAFGLARRSIPTQINQTAESATVKSDLGNAQTRDPTYPPQLGNHDPQPAPDHPGRLHRDLLQPATAPSPTRPPHTTPHDTYKTSLTAAYSHNNPCPQERVNSTAWFTDDHYSTFTQMRPGS